MTLLALSLAVLLLIPVQRVPAVPAANASSPHIIVIGFVGGFVRRDNRVHGPVRLAERLRRDYAGEVDVEMFENRHGGQAQAEILRRLHANHDGSISPEEKRAARIILYGHSWGGSEAIVLARQLEKYGVPVLLTIQVDSVAKLGQKDDLIPPNVAEAANFYQTDGLLHGQTQIRAQDSSRTRIIGNYKFEYRSHPIRCEEYPWYDRLFMRAHTEIECDPNVWAQVEALIRADLPEPNPRVSAE